MTCSDCTNFQVSGMGPPTDGLSPILVRTRRNRPRVCATAILCARSHRPDSQDRESPINDGLAEIFYFNALNVKEDGIVRCQ